MFDSGEIADAKFKDGQPVTEGVMSASKPLLPQLAAAGYKPTDIDYFALSHYHGDHTGNANQFAGATWIVQKADRDFMFGVIPQGTIIDVDSFSKLKDAKTKILNNENFDVFGDGTVVMMSTPGHTPGHQVLAVKLAHRGSSCSQATSTTIPRSARRSHSDVRVQRGAVESVAGEDRAIREGQQGRALDRARHRDTREAAALAAVR